MTLLSIGKLVKIASKPNHIDVFCLPHKQHHLKFHYDDWSEAMRFLELDLSLLSGKDPLGYTRSFNPAFLSTTWGLSGTSPT